MRLRAAVETLEDDTAARRRSMPTPVSTTRTSAPFVGRLERHVDRPPEGVNLIALPIRLLDHLAQALRVVELADRLVGHARSLSLTPLRSARRLRLLDGVLDHGAQVVRPQVEQDQARVELGQLEQVGGQPVEPLDLLAALLDELLARRRRPRRRLRPAAR